MNERIPEELLSAYLDGEASAEETARVEAWLAHSADARDELDEIQRVTNLLRSLPHESPGDEFVSAVMRRAERAVLIPSTPARAVARSRRGWIIAAGGLTVAAAAVLLILPAFFGPEATRQEIARNELDSHDRLPSAGFAERSGSATRTVAEADSVSRPQEPETLSFADAAAAPQPTRSEQAPSAPEATAEAAAGDEMRLAGRAGEDLKRVGRSMQNLADWNAVRVGDVVPYFCPPGDRAAVVRLTVVDVRKAAGDLQVLLAKNSVLPVAEEEAAETEQPDVRLKLDEQLRQVETEDGLLALYVESSDAQLLSALEAIEADEQFVAFELEPPVELEGVELAAVRGLNEQNRARADSSRFYRMETLGEAVAVNRMLHYKALQQKSEPGMQDPRASRLAAGSGRSERTVMERDVAKRQPDEPPAVRGPAELAESKDGVAARTTVPAETSESGLALNAFQMLVNVSGEPTRFKKANELQQRARLQAAQEPAADAAAPQALLKQTAQAESPPVRVIFIFQGREDHTQDG